jgi:hypothetical protein
VKKRKKNMKVASAEKEFVGFRPAPDVAELLKNAVLATGGVKITDIVQDCIRGCVLSVVKKYRKEKLPAQLAAQERAAAELGVGVDGPTDPPPQKPKLPNPNLTGESSLPLSRGKASSLADKASQKREREKN